MDLDTPVAAMLKLMNLSKYHLLYESVIGGETKARYSIIALDPDLIWKCENGKAFICNDPGADSPVFIEERVHTFVSLRAVINNSKLRPTVSRRRWTG